MWVLGVVIILMVSTLGVIAEANTSMAHVSLSPTEVWTTYMNDSIGTINATESMDSNGDGLAEIMVSAKNYTANTYSLCLLNGADGSTLNKTYFTDVGYDETGDKVGEDGTMYGVTVLDNNGNPKMEHYFMVFGNHSNNSIVSVYSVDYPSLENISYLTIKIPATITVDGETIDVYDYNWIFHAISIDGEPYLVYFGVYSGVKDDNGWQVDYNEIQVIVLDKNLNTVWERTEKEGHHDFGIRYLTGIDLIDFNGLGVTGGPPTVIFANLTSNSGSTTLVAYNTTNGNMLWETNITGIMSILNPISFFSVMQGINSLTFDFNGDNKMDMMIGTYYSDKSYLNFLDSSGLVLGYYTRDSQNISVMALHTDLKTGSFHKLINSLDVTNDGNGEVFFVDNNTNLVCWDVEQNVSVWKLNLINQSYNYMVTLSTNDLNGDEIWDIYLVGMNTTYIDGVKTKNVNLSAINPVTGKVLWSKYYIHAISGFVGNSVINDISDMNDDGLQDSLVAYTYYNNGSSLFINVSAISGNGNTLWKTNVLVGVNSTDFKNWSTSSWIVGDINKDGYGDAIIKLHYHNVTGSEDTYIKILSGKDGSLLWSGEVTGDSKDTDISAFVTVKEVSSWNQFDYNHDGISNEILITTAHSVQIYSVTQTIPELSSIVLLVFVPMVVFFVIRRH